MGPEFVNLSHRFGHQCPNRPYFKDVAIERKHHMEKSGVLSQTITTTMHVKTHIGALAHVVQGTPFIDEVSLPHFLGSGLVVSSPKKKWESITGDDLEKACGRAIRPGDVLIINTGWHKQYEDGDYFAYFPGLVQSGADWMVEKGVKVVGRDTQANDHPLATDAVAFAPLHVTAGSASISAAAMFVAVIHVGTFTARPLLGKQLAKQASSC